MRVFTPISQCHYCPEAASWRVFETERPAIEIRVCETHKFSPFS